MTDTITEEQRSARDHLVHDAIHLERDPAWHCEQVHDRALVNHWTDETVRTSAQRITRLVVAIELHRKNAAACTTEEQAAAARIEEEGSDA